MECLAQSVIATHNTGLVNSAFGSHSINTYEYGTWRQLMTEVKKW